ncbi:unnamed protein product, partial [Didymodactylos carnosus]
YFMVQEYRKPEYEVSSMLRPTTPHYCHPTIDEYVIAACQGKLFAGGFLNEANVQWTIGAERTKFTPAKRSDYTFGRAQHFFWRYRNNKSHRNENEISYLEQYFQIK